MDALKNPFKEALAAKQAQIGLWMNLADPYAAEVVGGAGFDWLLIDGEHAPNDIRTILATLQTLAAYPVSPVARPPVGDTHLIKQYLDIGVQTLLVPMVESAQQARDLVAAMQYPPHGVRGVGSAVGRAARWNRVPQYLQRAGESLCLLVQIESRKGLDNMDEILAVDGVDGVFIGPSDLSASLGHIGNPGHPEVQAVIEDAIRRITAAGKAAGILIADEKLARRYLELGALFVAVGTDISLLARSTEALAAKFKTSLPEAPKPGGVY